MRWNSIEWQELEQVNITMLKDIQNEEKKPSFRLENKDKFCLLMNTVQSERLKLKYRINVDKSSLRALKQKLIMIFFILFPLNKQKFRNPKLSCVLMLPKVETTHSNGERNSMLRRQCSAGKSYTSKGLNNAFNKILIKETSKRKTLAILWTQLCCLM